MTAALNPDCVVGKHHACGGDAWDMFLDRETDCVCDCHLPRISADSSSTGGQL